MTPFERLAAAYFLVLLTAARQTSRPRRGLLYAGGAIALIIVASLALPWALRLWLPHAYLALGYWIPAAFVPASPNDGFERWLLRTDVTRTWRPRSAVVRHVLEIAYLCCYPLVPAAFTVVFAFGSVQDAERFWLAVLGAGYACYITLPWTAARPPRLADTAAEILPHPVAAVNAALLGRVSHQLVTFPSGHVAVAVAAALSVWSVWHGAGVAVGTVAALIAVAAVAGRYHYLVDVALGVIVGLGAYVLAAAFL